MDLEGNPNFVKLAEAYGMKGFRAKRFRVKRNADVAKPLAAALAYNDGPSSSKPKWRRRTTCSP
jgi:acetolactate synthase-1/2/3 large subunit